jgi:hypothetical protein
VSDLLLTFIIAKKPSVVIGNNLKHILHIQYYIVVYNSVQVAQLAAVVIDLVKQ